MAYENDIYTRNGDSELAVRVVTATEGTNNSSYDDVFTRDSHGKLAVRVVGAGGGDSHNLGWFATPQALSEAYPSGEDGDYAIVGSTDTVWVWDADSGESGAWKDTDTKGQVESVNGQTGIVSLGAADVGAQPTLVSGTNIKTVDGNSLLGSGNLELSTYLTYPNGWTTNSTTKAFCDDIAADETAVKGKAYLGEVTCSDLPAGVLNAEIVVEIMDGTTAQDKIIVLSLKSGNVAPYAWQYVYWDNGTNVSGWKTWQETLVSGTNIKTVNNTSLLGSGNITIDSLPSQIGQSGKFLTTDGTDASWATINALQNTATGSNSLTILGTANVYSDGINIGNGSVSGGESVSVGKGAKAESRNIAIGSTSESDTSYGGSVAIGYEAQATVTPAGWNSAIAIGPLARATANGAIQISSAYAGGIAKTNSDANTFKVGNANGNFEIMSADGTIPADRLIHAINKYSTMPTASSSNEGWIVQFTGTTDSTYTHGHLYECVSDGQDPATYSWTEVQLGGSGSSYTAGTGIDITSGVISVTSPTVQNTATGTSSLAVLGTAAGARSVALGDGASAGLSSAITETIAIGKNAHGWAQESIAIGSGAECYIGANGAIQLGYGTNNTANTFQVKTYRVLDSDGTIPTARLTKVNSTITLAAADWSSNTQTVNVTGMTATGVVMVSPDPTDQADYTSAGILCTAQAAGTLTFTCSSVPSSDIDVNVVML